MDKYAKAIMGGLTSGLGALGTALTDGQVTAVEWVAVAAALVAGLGFVWGVPNKAGIDFSTFGSVQPDHPGVKPNRPA